MQTEDTWAPLGDYMHGNIIDVDFSHSGLSKGAQTPKLSGGDDAIQAEVTFEIVRALSSFTDAVVCVVRQLPACSALNAPSRDQESAVSDQLYLLKLFDRRHCNNLRDHHGPLDVPGTRIASRSIGAISLNQDGGPSTSIASGCIRSTSIVS